MKITTYSSSPAIRTALLRQERRPISKKSLSGPRQQVRQVQPIQSKYPTSPRLQPESMSQETTRLPDRHSFSTMSQKQSSMQVWQPQARKNSCRSTWTQRLMPASKSGMQATQNSTGKNSFPDCSQENHSLVQEHTWIGKDLLPARSTMLM